MHGEEKAARWLKQRRGFSHVKSFKHRHPGPYDIAAWKDGEHWIIEVKSEMSRGEPKVKIGNLLRMYEERGYDILARAGVLLLHVAN
jgi:Holliday junction resolvase-like predicted endonuclease